MYLIAHTALVIAVFCSLAGAAAGAAQLWQNRPSDIRWLEYAQGGVSLMLAGASAVLLYALTVSDFSLTYVDEYTERALPLFYRTTAFWAGQSGSMLFWALMVSLCGTAFLFTRTYRSLSAGTRIWFLTLFLTVMAFFGLLLSTWNDPFVMQSPAPADGQGLNPLLQNPGMIFHPPLLFLGYGGFIIPGCLALAQALSDGDDGMHWLEAARPFTLTGWLFLTAGIVLGGWWAYMELGWGGYWAWDPVENASLIPWLIGTAALHTGIVEQRRGKLHRTNIFLMSLTTVSAFFATYLVRGNVVNSVHGYGEGSVGPVLLAFVIASLAVITAVSLCASAGRKKELGGIETREGFVVLTVWLLLALCIIILTATLWPVISRLWSARPVGLDANFYNRVCLPLFTVLLGILAACPWLKWGGGLREWRKALAAGCAMCGALAVFWHAGVHSALPLMAASLCAAVIAGMALLLSEKGIRRSASSLTAVLVHIGTALLALGIAFSGPYKKEVETELAIGASASVGPFTVTLANLYEGRGANFDFIEAELKLSRGGDAAGTVSPQRRLYDKFTRSSFSEAETVPSLGNEFYATLLGVSGGKAVLRMSSNPLVNWIWIGGAVMSLAPFLGLRRRRTLPGSTDGE
ncbi:MAG: cytochrome c biogenesis protein CcsA [Mailhella sp.]|nr:cytochrome c biogenesis protein CcsA [Mailhella sp.]